MTAKSKYAEWRKNWRARPIEEGYVETRAFLSREDHERIVAIAQEMGERVPIILGQLLASHLATLDDRTRNPKPLESRIKEIARTKADMFMLPRMILQSRFKGDTGAARYRQIAFVTMVDAEIALGRRPIARSLALSVDSQPTQLELLAKLMEARGIVKRIVLPGVHHTKSGKALVIRDDAIEAFNRAHIEHVGTPLLPLKDDATGS